MTRPLMHFGWPVSPYSAKTRAHLRFKGVPFKDEIPSILRLYFQIRRAVGRIIMPTVRLPNGTWLQDSSEIIDAIEGRYPTPSIIPRGAAQRLAASLLELHGDEWLPMLALHYRWNVPENHRFALDEFGRYGLPKIPHALSRRAVSKLAQKMQSYLPVLGVTDATIPGLERFGGGLIAALEGHLSQHEFLLGSRPCIGDFALYGPLWAHLYRDPGTTRLFADAPHVVRWFERLQAPRTSDGAFLADDEVPATLDPIFKTLFAEQMPWVAHVVQVIARWCEEHPEARRVPRSLGTGDFVLGGHAGQRRVVTFVQWKAQRPFDAYRTTSGEARESADRWLARVGGSEAMRTQINHRLIRKNFKTVLAPW